MQRHFSEELHLSKPPVSDWPGAASKSHPGEWLCSLWAQNHRALGFHVSNLKKATPWVPVDPSSALCFPGWALSLSTTQSCHWPKDWSHWTILFSGTWFFPCQRGVGTRHCYGPFQPKPICDSISSEVHLFLGLSPSSIRWSPAKGIACRPQHEAPIHILMLVWDRMEEQTDKRITRKYLQQLCSLLEKAHHCLRAHLSPFWSYF